MSRPYESYVVPDSTQAFFRSQFAVPISAIPPDGLVLEVVDIDGTADAEPIGMARLTAAGLAQIFATPGHLLDVAQPGQAVLHLEVNVSAYVPLVIPATIRSVSTFPQDIGPRPIAAGEVIMLRAYGQYRVGSYYDTLLGADGYPGGGPTGYNFQQPPFKDAQHACAIALLGGNNHVQGVVVGAGRQVRAEFGGPLRVGVNDTEPNNNEGTITFQGIARAPTVAEWLGQAP